MAFESLAKRINDLPLVICGPILRRCEPGEVTVWVALKHACIVTLRIYSRAHGEESRLKLRMIGTRRTVGLGQHFHVLAITAIPIKNEEKLIPGELYYYNLFFLKLDYMSEGVMVVPESSKNLNSDNILNSLNDKKIELHYSSIYPNIHEELHLPTFSLPPEDLDSLRILHGSCRKLHNEGLDAMPGLDDILELDWIDANSRPHMLFLTGDQIYADDLSDTIMFLLDDASTSLMGYVEQLPDVNDADDLLPGNRKKVVKGKGGFTTNDTPEDGHNHLLRLGEYYAAYLFYWSDVLWPEDGDYPEFEQVYPGKPPRKPFRHDDGTLPTRAEYKAYKQYLNNKKTTKKYKPRILEVRGTLHKVRRALANIPTYMIFDDHDVTDDWNMNRKWCEKTLTKRLGYRVTQNALLAYAIFQAWGNTPVQFFENENSKGDALLKIANKWYMSYGTDEEAEKQISKRVGLPSFTLNKKHIFKNDTDGNKILAYDESMALEWNYNLKWPKFEVIVLDTRTRHSYPGKKMDPSSLLSASAFKEQIEDDKQNPGTLVTFVIAPTPVITFPFFRTVWFRIVGWFKRKSWDFDLRDHWQNQEKPFELLIAKLASRGPVNNNKRQSRIIILTGDVHFSSASRLQYWADKPFSDNISIPSLSTEAVFAQFSASSFKKQDKKTKYLHSHGHKFSDGGFLLYEYVTWLHSLLSNIPVLSTIVEWSDRNPGSTFAFGSTWRLETSEEIKAIIDITGSLAAYEDDIKLIVNAKERLNKKPDWVYRIDFILAENEVREPAEFEPRELILPADEEHRVEALRNYLAMCKNHEDYAKKWGIGKEIIGVNNFCEISFSWKEDSHKTVIQKSWWRLKGKGKDEKLLQLFPLSKFSTSLEFDDSDYKIPELPGIPSIP